MSFTLTPEKFALLECIGEFRVNGKLRIGDFAFINNELAQKMIFALNAEVDLKPRKYYVYVHGVQNIPDFGTRILGLLLVSKKNVKRGRVEITFEKQGILGVDTGTMAIVNYPLPSKDYMNSLILPTINKHGVFSLSGIGDGLYDYYLSGSSALFIDLFSHYLRDNMISPFTAECCTEATLKNAYNLDKGTSEDDPNNSDEER